MTWAPGPVVTRRRLGTELKRLRESAGLKLEDVARALECSTSKVSRLETGKGIPRARDVRDMLDLYRVADSDLRARLEAWVRDGQARMWWKNYVDVLTPDFATYVELEWDAAEVRAYESDLVHGLLQTRNYARQVLISAWGPLRSSDEIERLVEVRMRRQEALEPEHGLKLCCVLDESTLYRAAGGPDILREQLERLVELSTAEAVDLRVLPFSAGLVAVNLGAFGHMSFSTGIESGVVYLERPRGMAGEFLFEPAEVADYGRRMDSLIASSLDRRASTALVERAVDRLGGVPRR